MPALALPAFWTAVGAGATGAAAVGGAVSNNRAATKAAQLQAGSVDKAAELTAKANADALAAEQEQQRYERQQAQAAQQARAPYVEQGNRTLGTLADLLKVPKVNFSQPQGGQMPQFPGGQTGGTLASIYQQPNMPQLSTAQTGSTGQATAPTGGAMAGNDLPAIVTLQAPDGEIRTFPREQALTLIQRGARRVA